MKATLDRTYTPLKKRKKRGAVDARGITQAKSREIGALGSPARFFVGRLNASIPQPLNF
jgi:hypothetical protein